MLLVCSSEYLETTSTFNSRELILRQLTFVTSSHMVFSHPAEGHILFFFCLHVCVFQQPGAHLVVTLLIVFLRRIPVQHQNRCFECMETETSAFNYYQSWHFSSTVGFCNQNCVVVFYSYRYFKNSYFFIIHRIVHSKGNVIIKYRMSKK